MTASITKIKAVRALRGGSHVMRCHTRVYHGEYTVGQHSFDMLTLLFMLYPEQPTIHLVKAIWLHDMGEYWVGDAPSPALKDYPKYRKEYKKAQGDSLKYATGLEMPVLSRYEQMWLKALDLLELWLWCVDQLALGNTTVSGFITRLLEAFQELDKIGELPTEVDDFMSAVLKDA